MGERMAMLIIAENEAQAVTMGNFVLIRSFFYSDSL